MKKLIVITLVVVGLICIGLERMYKSAVNNHPDTRKTWTSR